MPDHPTGPATPAPSRRSLLLAGVVGVVGATGALGGCGLRLESDAPEVPLVPRERHPGADLLLAQARHVALALDAARADAARAPLARALVPIHAAQLRELHTRLTQVHEPIPAAPSAPPEPLVTAEAAGLDAAARTRLAQAPADDLALLGGIDVGRTVAARLLRAPTAPDPAPGTVVDAAEAARLLALLRPAAYGLEIAAAQAGAHRVPLARHALSVATGTRRILDDLAGTESPAPPLGYRLPFPVRDPDAADRLGRLVLTRLADGLVRALPRSAGHAAPLATLVGWAVLAETDRHAWGAALRPRPGAPG